MDSGQWQQLGSGRQAHLYSAWARPRSRHPPLCRWPAQGGHAGGRPTHRRLHRDRDAAQTGGRAARLADNPDRPVPAGTGPCATAEDAAASHQWTTDRPASALTRAAAAGTKTGAPAATPKNGDRPMRNGWGMATAGERPRRAVTQAPSGPHPQRAHTPQRPPPSRPSPTTAAAMSNPRRLRLPCAVVARAATIDTRDAQGGGGAQGKRPDPPGRALPGKMAGCAALRTCIGSGAV